VRRVGRSHGSTATVAEAPEENAMNSDQISGNWKQLSGKVKETWGKLTDDDLTVVEGKRDQLVGRIQERYGVAKEKAEEEVARWEKSL
jgi:uncharacterized protein YjbJ (UPF0337 family)